MLVGYPTRKEWLSNYNEVNTRKVLDASLKQFDSFLTGLEKKELEFFEYVRNTDEMELFRIIDKLKNQLTSKLSPTSAKYYLGHLMTWWRVNGISIDQLKLKSNIRWNKVHKEIKYTPDREEIQKIIDNSYTLQYKLFYHFAIATGARQFEILSLRKMDVDLNNEIPSVHFLAENTKTKQERYSFLTPECTDLLKKYYLSEDLDPKDKIFPMTLSTLQIHFQRIRIRLGRSERYSTGTSKLSIHRLRAYTKRQLSRNSGDNFAHLILGHAEGLGTYDSDNIESLRVDYTKAVTDLTIGVHSRTKQKEKDQDEEIKLLHQDIELLKMKIEHNTEN